LSSLETRTVRSVSLIGVAQLISLILTLLAVTVLTKILTPEDFGIVSIGMIFMALFTSFQDFGITPALIQRDTRIEDSISVGLSLRWIFAIALLALIIGISPFISAFYGKPAITLVLIVMSLNLLIQPIAFSSLVLLTRKLDFSTLAFASIVQIVTSTGVSIGLALMSFSYWSLVFGSLAGSISYAAMLLYYERTVFRPRIDRGLMKELLGFGSHLLIIGLMAFVIFNIDQLMVGRVLGIAVLGIFYVSVKFGRTFGEQVSTTVNKVLFPTMARMKDSIEHLKVGYVQSLRMIAIIAVPLSLGLSALSSLLVEVVLGKDWSAASIPIAILSIQGLLNALIPPASNVLISIGKPKYLSVQATVQAVAMVVGIYPVALYFGINGVCALTTILSLGVLIYLLVVFSRIFKVKLLEMASPIAPSLLSGFVVYFILAVLVSILPQDATSLTTLVAAGTVVYILSLHIASGGRDVRDFINLLRGSFLRRQNA
jgi:O-antigen/teichoic acid export membrane protein